MKELLMLYFLLKSSFNKRFTIFDSDLAVAVFLNTDTNHDFLNMICGLQEEVELPNVWSTFIYDLKKDILTWLHNLLHKGTQDVGS